MTYYNGLTGPPRGMKGPPPKATRLEDRPSTGQRMGPRSQTYGGPNTEGASADRFYPVDRDIFDEASRSSSYTRSPGIPTHVKPIQRTKSGFELEKEEVKAAELNGNTQEPMKRSKSVLMSLRKAVGTRKYQERLVVMLFLFVPFVLITGFGMGGGDKQIIDFGEMKVMNRSSLTPEELIRLSSERRKNSMVTIPALKALRMFEWSKANKGTVRPTYSIVAACKDRNSDLLKSLPTWFQALGEKDEIILLDWSSSEPMKELVAKYNDRRILLITVVDEKEWILSRAYNVGFRFASGDMVLKLDCDSVLDPSFFLSNPLSSRELSFARVQYDQARNENEQHLTGTLFVPREHLVAVHGYDERIVLYGYEDTELISRLKSVAGLKETQLNLDSIRHLPTSGALNIPSRMYSTQLNDILLAYQQSWSEAWAEQQSIVDVVIETEQGTSALAKLTTRTNSLSDSVSPEELEKSEHEAYGRVIHDGFTIPWDVIGELQSHPSVLLDALDSYGSYDTWTESGGYILAEVYGDAAERLLGLGSLLALSRNFTKPLFVSWDPLLPAYDTETMPDEQSDLNMGQALNLGSTADALGAKKLFFPLKNLNCRGDMAACIDSDSVYKYSVFGGEDDIDVELVKAVLQGSIPRKKSVIIRLNGSLESVDEKHRREATRALVGNGEIEAETNRIPSQSEKIGVYVGSKLLGSNIRALQHSLKNRQTPENSYLIFGSERGTVLEMQLSLSPEYSDRWMDDETGAVRLKREFIELLILSKTRKRIYYGYCTPSTLSLLQLLGSDPGLESDLISSS